MQALSIVLIQLLKGVIYQSQQPDLWRNLLMLLPEVQEYFAKIGLEIYIDEMEGYAFLKQKPIEEDDESQVNLKIIQKRPLSYSVSLLCVLLRKYLLEQDVQGGLVRPIIQHEKIVEMMSVYLPEKRNEARVVDQIDAAINKVSELGFLRRLEQNEKIYEIQRIIKAFIDADWLDQLDKKLEEYHEYTNADA